MALPVTPAGVLVLVCRLLVPPTLSDLRIVRNGASTVSLSVAEMGVPPLGGLMVALFDNVPVAVALTEPVIV